MKLPARDIEAILLMYRGLTNREIAERTNVSEHAIKARMHRLYSVFNVPNRAALLRGLHGPPQPYA